MAPELFVDTSAWYPLADPAHPDHGRLATAMTERVQSGARVVTTNLILAETHALLLRRVGAAPALGFLREVRRDPLLVEYITADLEARAIAEWLARFGDQPFSLADAFSFVVMHDRGIEEALTLDRHFSIAGFRMVPSYLG